MIKFTYRLLAIFLCSIFHQSNAQTLGPDAKISLVTIAPGPELWSFAGHSVIRIQDPSMGVDANFNYGLFDFRTESFYLKFLKGTLPYQLGAFNFRDELPYWNEDKRAVVQQELNLSASQKQRIYELLMENYRPENREYRYKFFYDNCSTRLRDVLNNAVGDSLKWSKTLNQDKSFRDWIKIYSQKSKNDWSEFGMDLLIGIPSDEKTGWNRAMYIPDNLMMAVDSAKIYRDSTWQALTSSKIPLNNVSREVSSLPIKPFTFFGLLFLIMLYVSYIEAKNQKWHLWLDKVLFSLTGLCGIIFTLLWLGTDHGVTEQNLNVLWAFPVMFPLVLFLAKTKEQKWLSNLFFLQMIAAILILLGFKWLPQTFNTAVIPIAGIVVLRSYLIWKKKK